jgi:hypothetical protein
MHVIAHIITGLALYGITKDPLALLGSVAPDVALVPNELQRKPFNKWSMRLPWLYRLTHSLLFPIIGFFVAPTFALASMLHIVMDIPFHTSALRWSPFGFKRYDEGRKALLLSGGMDSVACAQLERSFDCVFFAYGQSYEVLERPHAEAMARALGKELIIIDKPWQTDIPNRNFYMVAELAQRGYNEVIIGTRNLSPLGDCHGDSNWMSMKLLQLLLGVYINMPVVGLFKWQIKSKAKDHTYYSTEA